MEGGTDYGKQAIAYLKEAREHKSAISGDLREGYFFAAPHRERAMESESENKKQPTTEEVCDTSFAVELAEDFVTLIMNTFMPEAEPWAARRPGWVLPEDAQSEARDQIDKEDPIVFDAIRSSNFYAECAKGFMPDLALGTVGMWVDDPAPWKPIRCIAVPLHELEITLGPDGNVDFRAAVRHVRNTMVQQLLPGVTLPKEVTNRINNQPNRKSKVSRCFWRDWTEENDVVWHYCALVGNDAVDHKVLKGVGSMPLLVGRFGPSPEWPHGRGPLLKAMPDLRQYESLDRDRTDHSKLSLTPPIGVPDDSFTNFEQGIEPGMAYPIRPGSGKDVVRLYDPPPANAALYDQQQREQRLKRMFYLDWPEQQGKTPPSASQWLDQVAVAMRRIGMPGLPFWKEWCAEIFTRFAFLAEKRGAIKPVIIDGKRISLVAYNPAFRAVEQNDVAAFARFAEIAAMAFPEEWKIMSDGKMTMENLAAKLGANKIWAQRDPEEMQAAIEQISQVMGGNPAGAPDVGGGAPVPAPGAAPEAPIETRNYMSS